jgi:hypothetical protein
LVFYSLGYRFDFQKKRIVKTGGIFIKALPKSAKVLIDGKIKKKTDPFFGSALIENLFPKKYKVRVEKEEYFPWEKEVEIGEGKVAEFKGLILFPRNLNFYQILENIDEFWILPNQKELILKETEDGKWVLKSYSLDKKLKFYLVKQDDFSKEAEFLGLDPNQNSQELEIEVKTKEGIKNFALDLKNPSKIKEIEIPEDVICFKKVNEDFYFFKKPGYLFKGEEKMNSQALEGIENCELKIFNKSIFLKAGNNLYFLKNGRFEKIFENLKGMENLPGSSKLAIFSDYEIWIFDGEKIEFLNRFSEKIEQVQWINENYLIFVSQGKLKILETDKRDKINIWEIADFLGKNLFFNNSNKKIYFQKDKAIFESDALWR